jgi:hypothetical protein
MAAWLESAWLARYLDRELTPDETQWFEAYVLDKPTLLAMIENENLLRDALHRPSRPATPERTSRTWESVGTLRPARVGRLAWMASAASLLVGIALGSSALRLSLGTHERDHLIGDPTRMVFDTTRGVEQKPIVEHAGSPSAYVLIEVAVPPDAEHAELTLGETTIALTPSHDGFVSAIVERSFIKDRSSAHLNYVSDGQAQARVLPLTATSKGDQQ